MSNVSVELCGSPMKTVCAHMMKELGFKDGEGDSIYMCNVVDIKWPDNRVNTGYGAW